MHTGLSKFPSLLIAAILLLQSATILKAQKVLYSAPSSVSRSGDIVPLSEAIQRRDGLTSLELEKVNRSEERCRSASPLLLVIRNSYPEKIKSVLIRYISHAGNDIVSVGVSEVMYFDLRTGESKFPPGGLMIQGPHPMITDSLNEKNSQVSEVDLSALCNSYAARLLKPSPGRHLLVDVDSITLESGLVVGKDAFGVLKRHDAKKTALVKILNSIEGAREDRSALITSLGQILSGSRKASTWNLKESTDFVPIETSNAAQYALRGLESGITIEQLILSIQDLVQKLNGADQLRRF